MLSGTLEASLLGNLLAGKGIIRAGSGNKKGKRIQGLALENNGIFNATSSFSKFWNTKVLLKWTKIYWRLRSRLPKKIKDGAYVINLDGYEDRDTHWIALFCNKNEIVYFDSFGV